LLQRVAVIGNVVMRGCLGSSVLQRVAVCVRECSSVVRCVAVCYSVLQCWVVS